MLRQVKPLLMVGFILLFALPVHAQDNWSVEIARIYVSAGILPGAGATWDDSSQQFLSLFNRPGLWLARCADSQCVSEPIDPDASIGVAYLLRDDLGLLALYRSGAGITLAREGSPWTVQAAPLAQPCTTLIAAAQRSTNTIGLLCRDASNKIFHQWQDDGVWQAEELTSLDLYNLSDQALAYTPDGLPHVVTYKRTSNLFGYIAYRFWRDLIGAWHQEILQDDDNVYCSGIRIITDSTGKLWLAYDYGARWLQTPARVLYKQTAGGWTSAGGIWGYDSYAGISADALVPDPGGGVAFVYFYVYAESGEPTYYAYCAYWVADGNWCPASGTLPEHYTASFRGQLAMHNGAYLLTVSSFMGEPGGAYYESQDGGEAPVAPAHMYTSEGRLQMAAHRMPEGLVPYVLGSVKDWEWLQHPSLYRREISDWREFGFDYWDWEYPLTEHAISVTAEGVFALQANYYGNFAEASLVHFDFGGTYDVVQLEDDYSWSGVGDLATDANGNLAIAWRSPDADKLKFARRTAGGPVGDVTEVDQPIDDQAVTICDDGLARVAYRKAGAVYLATEGAPFTIELVDDAHTADGYLGITCEAGGVAHVIYDSTDGLLHATPDVADGWAVENIGAGYHLADVTGDADGLPYVAAGDTTAHRVDLFHLAPTGWDDELLAEQPYTYQAAMWSDDQDVMVCFVPAYLLECWSTAPIIGEPGTDDDLDDDIDDDVDDDIDDDLDDDIDDDVDDDIDDDFDDDIDDDVDDDIDDDFDDDLDDDADDDVDDDVDDDEDDDLDDDASQDDDQSDDDTTPHHGDDNNDDSGHGCGLRG